jgi:endonuclease YncB( thermonuclease family)
VEGGGETAALVQAGLARLTEAAIGTAERVAAGDVPSEVGLFAAGLGLILLIPTLARLSGDALRRPLRVTPPRLGRVSRPSRAGSCGRWGRGPEAVRQAEVELPAPFVGHPRIVDGDTVVVRRTRVRLHGIDAPEMDQEGGAEARAFLCSLVRGRSVTVVPIEMDIHGRTVARLEVEGIDLCRAMVGSGFAIAYRRYSTKYVRDERAARARRRGLWAACGLRGIESPAAHRYRARRSDVG